MIGSMVALLSTLYLIHEYSTDLSPSETPILADSKDGNERISEKLYHYVSFMACCEQPISIQYIKFLMDIGADPSYAHGTCTSVTSTILENFSMDDKLILTLFQDHKVRFEVFPHLIAAIRSGHIKNVVFLCRNGLRIDGIQDLSQVEHDLVVRTCLLSEMDRGSSFRILMYLVTTQGLRASEKNIKVTIELNRADCLELFLEHLKGPIDLSSLNLKMVSDEMKILIDKYTHNISI